MINKIDFKPENILYPAPAVMVSCGDSIDNLNIITISWTGNICTEPAMVYISIRPERYSYNIIERTREFVINLVNENLTYACDFCGVKSGRDIDKFQYLNLTKEKAKKIDSYIIKESPINIECKVVDIIELGTHCMFIANVVNIQGDESLIDKMGKLNFNKDEPIVYSHGEYRGIESGTIGTRGYSIKK